MPFAQLVVGPPGSGKSTYCDGMHQFLGAIGRKSSVVNLDPANDRTSYPCAIDIRELVSVDEIMSNEPATDGTQEVLGPNGAVLYALETLEANFDWLTQKLGEFGEDYLLFDCPGQVELFTHHSSLRNIFFKLQKLGYRLTVLHLTDSYALTQPSLYISTLLLSLRSMLQLDLPTLNVLTKIDKLASYTPLPFPLSFYTQVQDLEYLTPYLESENATFSKKFASLNQAVIGLVEDFGLVGFETLVVEDRRSMMTLLQAVDRAGGYAFGSSEGAGDGVWATAMREGYKALSIEDVQERWVDRREEMDEREIKEEKKRLGVQDGTLAAERIAEDEKMDDTDDEDERDLEKFRRKGEDPGVTVKRSG